MAPLAALILIALMLCSCERALTNEEVVRQAKFCEQNGMLVRIIQNELTYSVIRVQCIPKVSK